MSLLLIGSVSIGLVLGWWVLGLMRATGSVGRRVGSVAAVLTTCASAAFLSVAAAGAMMAGCALGAYLHAMMLTALCKAASSSNSSVSRKAEPDTPGQLRNIFR